MSNALSALFLAVMAWVVLSLFATAWDAESSAREALDRCLSFGGTVAQCQEVAR